MNNNFVTPFLPILGLLSEVKAPLACIYHSIFGDHYNVGYDTVFLAFALSDKLMSIVSPIFCITPFGVAVRGKASLKIACICHSVLGEPQGTI